MYLFDPFSPSCTYEVYYKDHNNHKDQAFPFRLDRLPNFSGDTIIVRSFKTGGEVFRFTAAGQYITPDKIFTGHGIDPEAYDNVIKEQRDDDMILGENDLFLKAAKTRTASPICMDKEKLEYFKDYVSVKYKAIFLYRLEEYGIDSLEDITYLDKINDERFTELARKTAEAGLIELTAALMQKLHERGLCGNNENSRKESSQNE